MGWETGPNVSERAIERKRYVELYEAGELSRKEVAEALDLSERQVTRLIGKYTKNSILGLNHGNFGKPSSRATPKEVVERTLELARTKYAAFNATHFHEKLLEVEKIKMGASTLRNLMKQIPERKCTRRSVKKRKLRPRMPRKGIMLQMDGSDHEWVKGKKWCLISGIDDATSEVPFGIFAETEGLDGYLSVLRKLAETWGLPQILYVDRASWLSGTTQSEEAGQFKRICKSLGVTILYASSPQAKGRIERLWGTFQDRLVAELYVSGITEMDKATQFLNEEFLPKQWNSRFTVLPQEMESKLKPRLTADAAEEAFSYRYDRKVRNDETILWGNRLYQVQNTTGFSLARRKLEIHVYPDGHLTTRVLGKKLEIVPIERIEDRTCRPPTSSLPQGLRKRLQANSRAQVLETTQCKKGTYSFSS